MQHLLTLAWAYVSAHHMAILALFGGSAGVSALIQWFIHRYKIQSDKLAFTISHLFALATAASAYILSSVHPNVGYSYAWIWFFAQFWHRFAVNPIYKNDVLPLLDQLEKAKAVQAPATPAVTVPTTNTVE